MNRRAWTSWALAAAAWASAARADEATVEVNGRAYQVPAGFTVEPVAGPPLVDRPVTADFDEAGALYVADSSGSNEPLTRQLVDRPHRILRLVDDGDGRYDRRTVFADRMMFPAGTLWHDGSLYVAAPPSIWKLTDTDGDGVADVRQEWFAGKTLTHCGNDLHGPYLGRDGRIYWTKGAFAEQAYPRPGRPPLVTRAAHIFRARPYGSDIEPVMTGGMDNPVDVAFAADGERFFTTTFLQHPADGLRDGILHAVYGGVFGKANPALEGHPRTGPDFLPTMTHLGAAAPSGLAMLETDALGPNHSGSLLAAQFNRRRVSRHVLIPDGATYRTEDSDLIRAEDRDFHPTDVLEDADGSAVVVDTGGWYKLCCPTSQLEKPDVLGSILRVRRAGAPRAEDPRGLALAWGERASADDLAGRLGDARPAVRRRAMAELARRGDAAVAALGRAIRGADPRARLDAAWAACRIDGDAARAIDRLARRDADPTVRRAGLHAAALHRDRAALDDLRAILAGATRPEARLAAEALGRIGDPSAVPDLLRAAAGSEPDPAFAHAVRFALIEIDAPGPTRLGLAHPDPAVQRAALVALDQMPSGGIEPADVLPRLAAPDPRDRDLAGWVAAHHRDWGDALVDSFRTRIDAGEPDLAATLARFSGSPPVRGLLAGVLADPARPDAARAVAAGAMARADLAAAPPEWSAPLAAAIDGAGPEAARAAVAAVAALPWGKSKPDAVRVALLRRGRDPKVADAARLAALAAVPGGLAPIDPADLRFLLDQAADADRPAPDRSRAADLVAATRLDDAALPAVAEAVRRAGPMEVHRLVGAFAASRDDAAGLALADALLGAASRDALQLGLVAPIVERFGPEVRDRAKPLLATLDAGEPDRRARLRDRLARLDRGDVRRGQAVFDGPKAACGSCHAIGYLGGRVGPDLSRIGQVRGDADLVESILFPSASFVRGYEPVAIATADGLTHQGVLADDGPDSVTLAVAADRTVRIPRDQVEAIRPGGVSVMPSGFDAVLSDRELSDLVAFLRSRR